MSISEVPVIFSCQSNELIGVVHQPKQPINIGVLVVVGGPQYRVGSHRQFVLLARILAANGVPVLRFDYRGMGDSTGEVRDFSSVDADIHAAINTFYQQCSNLASVVIWGLCDAASASVFYAYQDERVRGLVLLNPWVFTEKGAAKTYLKHYYLQRLLNPDFWHKVFSLQFDYRDSFSSLLGLLNKLRNSDPEKEELIKDVVLVDANLQLPIRVRDCLLRFNAPVLFVLSGKDLTADEFRDVVKSDTVWQTVFKRSHVKKVELESADHTFSSASACNEVAKVTLEWVKQLDV